MGMDWQRARGRDRVRGGRAERPVVAWWLTPAREHSRCSDCGARRLDVIAFNPAGKRTLCSACVERLGIGAQPSRALLAQRRKER